MEAVVCLLEAGAELNRRNTVGGTPLFQAIHMGHVPAVTALVQAGSCPYASNSVWWTKHGGRGCLWMRSYRR